MTNRSAGFLVIPNIKSTNLCKSINDIINYSTSICPLNPESVDRKRKNYKNFEKQKSPERKEFFQWNEKTFFIVLEGLSFGEKIKIW